MKLILKLGAIVIALFLSTFGLFHASQARLALAAAEGEGRQTNADAPTLYSKHCATCHGKDGRAKTTKSKFKYHARDLTDAEWQARVSDERIFNSINNGRGKMPDFEKKLSESQINALVGYIRHLK